jgi:formylglycine-generating enzyme required for sulfatase activity
MTGTNGEPDPNTRENSKGTLKVWSPVAIALAVLALGSVAFGLRSIFLELEKIAGNSGPGSDSKNQSQNLGDKDGELRRRLLQKRAEFDAMIGKMIVIPAGSFQMGQDDEENNERPVHRVQLNSFEIDEIEVSVASWQKCMSQGKCDSPQVEGQCNFARPERRMHPINCVTWNQAKGFCEWAVKRLPTEEEWEYVARGPENHIYPWGNSEPSNQLCWRKGSSDGSDAGTCLSTEFDAGSTSLGVRDLAGNLSEWTSSAYCPYSRKDCEATSKVIRGASWLESDPAKTRSAFRMHAPADIQNPTTGFRCVRDHI